MGIGCKEVFGLVMSGGQGRRLWPLSTKKFPKQYLSLVGGKSFLKHSLERLRGPFMDESLYVVTTEAQRALALKEWDQVLCEPHGRNTAPAIYLALLELRRRGCGALDVLGFFPSDHLIDPVDLFHRALEEGLALAARREDHLVLMGISPRSAHTSYGYLQKGVGGKVAYFVEKPVWEVAKRCVDSGDYLWNGGIFLGTWQAFYHHFQDYFPSYLAVADPRTHYHCLEAHSFDCAVLENSQRLLFVEGEFQWSDIGEWSSLVSVGKGLSG